MRSGCARFDMLLAQPRTPWQRSRRTPGTQSLLLSVARVPEPDRVRQPTAGRQDGDVLVEK
jgi:hypothetical protein